jgi:hypothetical protein
MTKKYKVANKVPFPVAQDKVFYYYVFEEDPGLAVGQEVEITKVVPDMVSIDSAETPRDLGFYDLGSSDVMEAMQRLLKGQGRDGVSQRKWQALKEQVWQLQDLADTCADLEKLEVDPNHWWYRIDGRTRDIVLFSLGGSEREMILEGDFESDEEKTSFAKGISTLINLSQDIRHSLKARVIAQNLFYNVKVKAKDIDQTNGDTEEKAD